MIDVGLIGFGLAGRYFHAPLIHAVPGLRLAAVLQRSGDEAAKRYPGVRIVRSIEGLLAIDSIRLVVIASPNQTHFPFAVQCLEAGRDVVVDKPITPTLPEALELFRVAKKCGRLLTVFHSRRFDAIFRPCVRSSRVVNWGESCDSRRTTIVTAPPRAQMPGGKCPAPAAASFSIWPPT